VAAIVSSVGVYYKRLETLETRGTTNRFYEYLEVCVHMGCCHEIPMHMTRFHIPPTFMCFSMLPTSQGRAHDTCVWSCLAVVRVSQHGVRGGDLGMSTISSTYRKALTQLWSSTVADCTCPRWGTRCGRTGSALDVHTVSAVKKQLLIMFGPELIRIN
jgi:hypothetical protein